MKVKSKARMGILILLILAIFGALVLAAVPSGPAITNKGVENGTAKPATMLNTSGGTITTIILNATTQNPHWKAYVGNVTGSLVLEDAKNYSIYEWAITSAAGEVYVTRNNSITWSNIECANTTHVNLEDTAMSHVGTAADSVNSTFTRTTHQSFWTGATEFIADECNKSIITYVNDTVQDATENFQEILLWDGASIVYTTIIEDGVFGFDRGYYDFQLIVPENGSTGPVSSTPYYFYVELV